MRRFHLAQRPQVLLQIGALAGIIRADRLVTLFQQLRGQPARQGAVVLPVVQRLEVRQRDGHIGSVIRHRRADEIVRFLRVRQTAHLPVRFRRLIERREENRQKRHVVGERHAAAKAVAVAQ